jgi:nucleotide sugar dehydrogenase
LTRISVFGLGHVGLVTAACFAKKGHEVVGIDPDVARLGQIGKDEVPFFEPKLADYLKEATGKGMLRLSADASANTGSDVAYIAVGTPSNQEAAIDLTYVRKAAADIGRSLRLAKHQQLVVVKSTVTPGTARRVVKPAIEKESGRKCGEGFWLCSNPEFLREGHAIEDTERPDRIVIGSDHTDAIDSLSNFYVDFHERGPPPIIKTSHENAELIKYASNAFLATKISFINTIANIAERIQNADVTTIAKGMGLDARIAPRFLDAGLGYGGSCFPKDVSALVATCCEFGYTPQLLEATMEVNRTQPLKAVEFAKQNLGSLVNKSIAVLGLAFKPHTDDMRDAVSIPIINTLLQDGAQVFVCDPAATENARQIFGARIHYSTDARDALAGAELAIIVTEWDEFKRIRPEEFRSLMKTPRVFDGRRIYNPKEMIQAGIIYDAIGLGKPVT